MCKIFANPFFQSMYSSSISYSSSHSAIMIKFISTGRVNLCKHINYARNNDGKARTDHKDRYYLLNVPEFLDYMSLVVRKPFFGVPEQVRHKPGCTATETG